MAVPIYSFAQQSDLQQYVMEEAWRSGKTFDEFAKKSGQAGQDDYIIGIACSITALGMLVAATFFGEVTCLILVWVFAN